MSVYSVKCEKLDEKHYKVTLPVETPSYGFKFDGWYEDVEAHVTQENVKRLGGSGETVIVNVDDLYAQSRDLKDDLINCNRLTISSRYSKISKRKDPCEGVSMPGCDVACFAQAIPVDDKHKDKINAAIAQAEGRARVRTLNYNDVKDLCERFEGVYEVKKRYLDGCCFSYIEGADDFASSYRGMPYGTEIYATHHKGKWYLVGAERVYCNHVQCKWVYLSADAKSELMDRVRGWF